MKRRILIFVVCYNAEHFVERVLNRIPDEMWRHPLFDTEVLVIDDDSTDGTFYRAHDYASRHPRAAITVLHNPKNQGYGGNQKLGYHYAIEKGFDIVVLLHGDGQYAPEYLPQMVHPILDGAADVVLGSRMIRKRDALKGGMPLYKWLGNQVLTAMQNRILSTTFAELHTGYRAYSVPALASIPFPCNSDGFSFDTDILIQLSDKQYRIAEIPIPTFYGDEISRVNGVSYALSALLSSLLSRTMRCGIFYHPKFDYEAVPTDYPLKLGYPSSHEFALARVAPGSTVLDVGCGPGLMARELAARQVNVISIDRTITPMAASYSRQAIEADLDNYDFGADLPHIDAVFALDIIEHLKSPERLLQAIRQRCCRDRPAVIVTTGNVAFLPVRFSLAFGRFNYGRRGILDLDHTRLFTLYSLRRLLRNAGYDILEVAGIPAPYPAALGDNLVSRLLLRVNRLFLLLSRSLFAYQIAIVAVPRPTLAQLLDDAKDSRERKLCELGRNSGA